MRWIRLRRQPRPRDPLVLVVALRVAPPPPEKEHSERNEHYGGDGGDDDATDGTAREGFR